MNMLDSATFMLYFVYVYYMQALEPMAGWLAWVLMYVSITFGMWCIFAINQREDDGD